MSEPKLGSADVREERMCPFRHPENTPFGEYNTRDKYPPDFYTFAPCLQDKCAMWRRVAIGLDPNDPEEMARIYDAYCGLAGKP